MQKGLSHRHHSVTFLLSAFPDAVHTGDWFTMRQSQDYTGEAMKQAGHHLPDVSKCDGPSCYMADVLTVMSLKLLPLRYTEVMRPQDQNPSTQPPPCHLTSHRLTTLP